VFLHDRKGLGKKDRKGWHCDKILVHLKKIALFCNSCYICLCGATLVAGESWKVVFIE